MIKAFKTEIKPTPEQANKINQTVGVCRYLYNLYIQINQERYKQGLPFMSANDFDKWINNVHSKQQGFEWIKSVSSKARKKSIVNAEIAFKRFFKKLGKFPRFKKKRNQDVNIYFPKNNNTDWTVERHRIKIPTIGWMRLKEFGYIPYGVTVKSGTVSYKAGRYYVSVIVDIKLVGIEKPCSEGIGVDLGVKDFAVVNTGIKFKNINKTSKIKKLERRLKREQRKLSRKYYMRKQRGGTATALRCANIDKQRLKVQKIHQRLTNIRTDYVNKTVNELVKTKPVYITVENLNVSGMMKNRHLSRAIAHQKFYEFNTKLKSKTQKYNIELRVVDRFYPSSKLCSCCGHIKWDLKLSDRIYICDNCGFVEDRDVNASINLRDAKQYKIS